ncbi:MAG: SMEK domain-containing protein, partial [Methylococcales bacterium]
MNRSDYFNFIERELSILATRISVRGGLNILDLNIHSENFYLNFFNLLFDWHLTNINSAEQNAAAVDLVDKVNNIIIQVSATATKQK